MTLSQEQRVAVQQFLEVAEHASWSPESVGVAVAAGDMYAKIIGTKGLYSWFEQKLNELRGLAPANAQEERAFLRLRLVLNAVAEERHDDANRELDTLVTVFRATATRPLTRRERLDQVRQLMTDLLAEEDALDEKAKHMNAAQERLKLAGLQALQLSGTVESAKAALHCVSPFSWQFDPAPDHS